MFATDDTIVAIATPPGRGALGVVRLSGRAGARSRRRVPRSRRHAATTTRDVHARAGRATAQPALDEVVATFFPAPHSYTGERCRRDHRARQSRAAARACSGGAIAAGARLAEPGEFTLRAFLQRQAGSHSVGSRRGSRSTRPRRCRRASRSINSKGTLTERIAAIDARLVRSDRAARGVARFSGRGLSLRGAGRAQPRTSVRSSPSSTGCSPGAARRADDPRRARRSSSRAGPNVGKV